LKKELCKDLSYVMPKRQDKIAMLGNKKFLEIKEPIVRRKQAKTPKEAIKILSEENFCEIFIPKNKRVTDTTFKIHQAMEKNVEEYC
jgi:hypothetical protein